MPLLSIIIPIYNAEKYLSRCITSIQSNTFSDWELILVDDGSTDNSGDICDTFSKKDGRIKAIHQQNSGQSKARNNGMSQAHGQYITFVDADDEISKDVFSLNISYMENHLDVDFLQYPTIWNCNTSESRKDTTQSMTIRVFEDIFVSYYNNSPLNFSVWNKIFRHKTIKGINFVSGRLYEDKLFLLEVIRKSKMVYLSQDGEYYYYKYPESSINRPTFLRRISWVESEYILLEEMYSLPSTSNQWLKRWMTTNRYLANTHHEFSNEDISVQLSMMQQTTPSIRMKWDKDYLWYAFIRIFGEKLFLKTYCCLLRFSNPIK